MTPSANWLQSTGNFGNHVYFILEMSFKLGPRWPVHKDELQYKKLKVALNR